MPRHQDRTELEQPTRSKKTTGSNSRSRSKSSGVTEHQRSLQKKKNLTSHHSFEGLSALKKARPQIQPVLRVKSQYQSLKHKGLARINNSNKRVEISFLEVREYPLVLGDNPACAEGPALSIDWAHDPQTVFILDVATFERMRGVRRTSNELVISKYAREKKLARVGVSKKEIAQAVRESRKIKHHRMVSSQQIGMDNMHESMEKVTSGIKSMFAWKKSSYESMLQAAVENQGTFAPAAVRSQ